MNYNTICEENKFLYGHLEQCAVEIGWLRENGANAEELELQLRSLKVLIDINLEKLEQLWLDNGEMYVPEEIEAFKYPALNYRKSELVLNTYLENPNRTMKQIAFACSVGLGTVNTVIRKYFLRERKEVS